MEIVKDNGLLIEKPKKEKTPPLPSYQKNLALLNPRHDKYRQRKFASISEEYQKYRREKRLDELWVSTNYDHYIPNNLFGSSSNKTMKGSKKKIATYILYMSPEKASGRANMCAFASPECASGCLATSGQAGMPTGQVSQRNKTILYGIENKFFMDCLYREVYAIREMFKRKTAKDKERLALWDDFCIRLNGTSDQPFINMKITSPDGVVYKNIFEAFPDVQFYDYTKSPNVIKNAIPSNYDVTFSRAETEDNQRNCLVALENGFRVAVVFNRGKYNKKTKSFQYPFPSTWHGYKVIDGDETDLRFLDPTGVVIGLSVKGNEQQKKALEDFKSQRQGFFVQPDENGNWGKAENATIFGTSKKTNMPRFKKGSKEAKAYMAKLRQMRSVGATLILEDGETPKTKPRRIVQVKRTRKGVFKRWSSISGYTKGTTQFFEKGEKPKKGGIVVTRRKKATATGREGTFKSFQHISGVPSSMGAVKVAIDDVKKHSDLIAYYKDHIEKTKNFLKANSRNLDMRSKAAMRKDIAEHMKTIAHHKKMLSQAKKMIK